MSEQPLPGPGQQSVTRAVMALLEERERKGIATYGKSLSTFNGRVSPRDLVEELIDGAQYALQWEVERAELIAIIHDLTGVLIAIAVDPWWTHYKNGAVRGRAGKALERWNQIVNGVVVE